MYTCILNSDIVFITTDIFLFFLSFGILFLSPIHYWPFYVCPCTTSTKQAIGLSLPGKRLQGIFTTFNWKKIYCTTIMFVQRESAFRWFPMHFRRTLAITAQRNMQRVTLTLENTFLHGYLFWYFVCIIHQTEFTNLQIFLLKVYTKVIIICSLKSNQT